MHKGLFALALGLVLAAPVRADVLGMPQGEPKPKIDLPAKGTSMADVEKKFGEPRQKHATVGGDAPKHPPITRWDYDGFTVVFEKDKVVDALVPGAPPKIYHKDKLKGSENIVETPAPAEPAPAAMPAATPEPAPAATPAEMNPSPRDAPAPGITTEKPRSAEPPREGPPKEPEATPKPPPAAEKPS
jgi:hypothetical protein